MIIHVIPHPCSSATQPLQLHLRTINSLQGQRFSTLSVNRRRWLRLWLSSFSSFLRHRFPLPLFSPQGNATLAWNDPLIVFHYDSVLYVISTTSSLFIESIIVLCGYLDLT
ncbi:Uncharacterized protein Rs2_49403 [Raphanus sativus]|nr:Uncharacterized protein Rs2_49403 [Raphanus sativus]